MMKNSFSSLIFFFAICCLYSTTSSGQATGTACNAGLQSQLSTNATLAANTLYAFKYNVPIGGTLKSISIFGRQAGANVKLALYSEGSNAPNGLLANSAAGAMIAGVVSLDVPDAFISPGDYWIAVLFDASALTYSGSSGTRAIRSVSLPFANPFPINFGALSAGTNALLNVWLDITCCPTIDTTIPNSRCGTGTVSLGATGSAGTLNWYASSSGGPSLGTGTTFVTPSIGVTTPYYVAVTDGACTSSRTEVVATVNNLPAQPGTIGGNTTICSATSNTYSISIVSGATSYTWTFPGGWTGTSTTNSITTVASGTSGNVAVTANNTCGSTTAQTLAVTVNSIPAQPGTISGNTAICSGSSNTYGISAVSGATSYTWTFPGGWTGTSTTNSITAVASATSGNVSVTADNTCGPSTAQALAITVSTTTPVQPGIISGSATICSGSSNTYSILDVNGATNYTWTLPGGWTGTSTTNSITAVASTTSGDIAVIASNACGSSSVQTLGVTVNSIPTQPGAISGNSTICSGSSNTYSVSAVSGATSYTWILPNGWTGTSTTNSITGIASTTSGSISVTASNGCGPSAVRELAVTVNSVPTQPGAISGNTAICSGSSNTFSISAVSGATSYTWILPSGWTGTSTTTSIAAVASATSGDISVIANNACGSSAVQTSGVTVNSIPTQAGAISGNTAICSESSNTYSVSAVSGATSYTWTLPSGWTGTSTTTSIAAVASATSGNVSVIANNACGSSAVQTLGVTVGSAPTQPGAISGSTAICSGSSNSFSISAVSGATSYTWTLPSGWTGSSITTSITTVASATSGSIAVRANNTCGPSTIQVLTIVVTSPVKPAITVNSTNPEAPVLTAVGGNSFQWFSNGAAISGATNSTYTVTAEGTYTVQATVNGCTSEMSEARVIVITGMADDGFGKISLYPNPASSTLIISLRQFKAGKEVGIAITDMLGRATVSTNGIGGTEKEIDVRSFSSGTYLVILQQMQQKTVVKFVKSN